MEKALEGPEREARIIELERLIREGENAARMFAADADVKGPNMPGYADEMAGRERIRRQVAAYREELARLRTKP